MRIPGDSGRTAPRAGFHPDRAAGRDRDHRGADRVAPARRPGRPRGRPGGSSARTTSSSSGSRCRTTTPLSAASRTRMAPRAWARRPHSGLGAPGVPSRCSSGTWSRSSSTTRATSGWSTTTTPPGPWPTRRRWRSGSTTSSAPPRRSPRAPTWRDTPAIGNDYFASTGPSSTTLLRGGRADRAVLRRRPERRRRVPDRDPEHHRRHFEHDRLRRVEDGRFQRPATLQPPGRDQLHPLAGSRVGDEHAARGQLFPVVDQHLRGHAPGSTQTSQPYFSNASWLGSDWSQGMYGYSLGNILAPAEPPLSELPDVRLGRRLRLCRHVRHE